MRKELQETLYESFPKLFERRHLPKQETAMCYGISCGDGWFPIIYNLCEVIQSKIDQANFSYESALKRQEEEVFEEEKTSSFGYRPMKQVYVDQLKSKFDGMRFYLHEYNCDPFVVGAIAMAERQSRWVCQHCGEVKIHPSTHNSCKINAEQIWLREKIKENL
jgi:hypothetical protein